MIVQQSVNLQLELHLRQKIATGEYKYGEMIPSERKLSDLYGVSRVTVRKALEKIEADGFLVRIQGKGAFVTMPHIEQTDVINSFSAILLEKGIEHKDVMLYSGRTTVNFELSEIFKLPKNSELYRIYRLRLGNGNPIALEDTFILPELIDNIDSMDFSINSPHEAFAANSVEIGKCRQVLSVVQLTAYQAKLLKIPTLSVCFMSKSIIWDKHERIIEYTISYRDPRVFIYAADLR